MPIWPLTFGPDRECEALPCTATAVPNPVSPLHMKLEDRSNFGLSTLPLGLHTHPSEITKPSGVWIRRSRRGERTPGATKLEALRDGFGNGLDAGRTVEGLVGKQHVARSWGTLRVGVVHPGHASRHKGRTHEQRCDPPFFIVLPPVQRPAASGKANTGQHPLRLPRYMVPNLAAYRSTTQSSGPTHRTEDLPSLGQTLTVAPPFPRHRPC